MNSLKGIKIVHWNACSLVNKTDEIHQRLLGTLSIDVLCITESWLKPHHDCKLFEIDNYMLYREDHVKVSATGAYIHGGGVVCYVKNSIILTQVITNLSTLDLELLTISLGIPNQCSIYLLIAYRPPSSNYLVALNKLTDCITDLRSNNGRQTTILCGDLNIDWSKPKNSPNIKALTNFCRELSLQCTINSPTQYWLTSFSIIDLFLTDSDIVVHRGTMEQPGPRRKVHE